MCCGIQLPALFSQEHWSSSGWDFQPIVSSWITAALTSPPSRVVSSRYSCFRIAASPVALALSASSVAAALCTPALWRMQVGFKFFAALAVVLILSRVVENQQPDPLYFPLGFRSASCPMCVYILPASFRDRWHQVLQGSSIGFSWHCCSYCQGTETS